jgi:hypothetical protein
MEAKVAALYTMILNGYVKASIIDEKDCPNAAELFHSYIFKDGAYADFTWFHPMGWDDNKRVIVLTDTNIFDLNGVRVMAKPTVSVYVMIEKLTRNWGINWGKGC